FGVPSSGYTNDRFAGTGTYGMNSSGIPTDGRVGSKGSNVPSYDEMPPPAPPRPAPNVTARSNPYPARGLNDQVRTLEQEVFGRAYLKDPLPARLNRLESTVFPQEKAWVDKSLPDRVNRLTSIITLSQPGRRIAQNSGVSRAEPGYEDYGDLDIGQSQLSQPRATSGLSKIINSISSFLGGGYAGGYPSVGGNLITDPQTGLLYDSLTGSLIDPVTGVVVGQRLSPGVGSSMGGFGSFSNGFSPFGSLPYGMGSGSGIRFGYGGIGRYGYSMWP
ncbi:MAG: hypothetical protein HY711_03445, partial [Candidatus Melainabacteria bacterium]|nr:hypothetical protein [Candidatus Melainabacteria bacterium]